MDKQDNQTPASVGAGKTFTQEELNGIVAKEIAKAMEKVKADEKIEQLKNEHDEYKSKYETLINSQKINNLKDIFIKNGGVSDRYDDFIKLNNDILNKDPKDYDNEVKKSIESKPYLFDVGNQSKSPNQNQAPIKKGDT
jgi:hypothetical protein